MAAPHPFPQRPLDAHKRTCGDALVVAGSRGMSGAAFLTARACLRGGAGLVTLACPEGIHDVLEVKTTCAMTRPLPQTPEGTLSQAALQPLLGLISGRSVVALGPGLSRHPETADLIRSFVRVYLGGLEADQGPKLVLDADGLNAFEGQGASLAPLAGRAVLTPHPGEFRRLVARKAEGSSAQEAAAQDGAAQDGAASEGAEAPAPSRTEALEAFVRETGVTTLLKGKHTLVCGLGPEGEVRRYVNETGNPGMATAGSGDVLTGLIAALLAQGLAPFEAASLGAWLHGRAGDLRARHVGWAPLLATDLLDGLVEAIRDLEAKR